MNEQPDKDGIEEVLPERVRAAVKYFNGESEVWGDPLTIMRRLEYALQGQAMKVIREALSPSPSVEEIKENTPEGQQLRERVRAEHLHKTFEAKERLLPAIKIAFGMKPFDPDVRRNPECRGATEKHCIDAIKAWVKYYVSVKKNGGP